MKLTRPGIAAVAAFLISLSPVRAEQTVAYVNMARVFERYYKTAQQEKTLREQEAVYKDRAKELATETDALKKKRDELQERAMNVALSDTVRTESRQAAVAADELYKEKQLELRSFFGNKQKELRAKYMEARQEIVKEILAYVKDYSGKKSYDLVYDVSGLTNNFLPVILYYPEEQEITDEIMAALNTGHEDEVPPEPQPATE